MGHVIDRKCLKERGFFFHFCNNFGFGKNIKRVNIYSMLPSIQPVLVTSHLKQRPFYFSVNKAFQMEAEDVSFKMQVFAGLQLEKQ